MKTLLNSALCKVFLWGLVLVFSGVAGVAQEPSQVTGTHSHWKAGAAKVKITPEAPMWMAGYAARTKPAISALSDLWAKVLVLETADEKPVILITLDLVGIDRELANEICKPLIETFEIDRARIAICCSHTHSGPALWRNLGPLHYMQVSDAQRDRIRAYTDDLPTKIFAAAKQAFEQMQPSALSWGMGSANFAVNRRENTPESVVPSRRAKGELAGPSQHDVPVLAVRRLDGKLSAVVFGYACHSTVLDGYRWCGDYPGFAQSELEETHAGCVALFWAGCGADQNPIPRRSVALAKHYGRRLATAVDRVLLTTAMQAIAPKVDTRYEELPLAYAQLPTKAEIEIDAGSENRYTASRAKLLLATLESEGVLPTSYPFPIASWQLGDDVRFVFLGGETVIDYAVRLHSELPARGTWVASYANDVMAYIPSERVLAEGGYEGGGATVYYGLPAPWRPGLENEIVTRVLEQHKKDSSVPLERIVVNDEGNGFVTANTRNAFTVWGANYDHNEKSQLLEEYWQDDWEQVGKDFEEMKELGVNVARIHLQLGRFMRTSEDSDPRQLARLGDLLDLAQRTGIYLNLTGLGCYRKADVPEWYDVLEEQARWEVQATFWRAIADTCKGSTAVFCYDLMNEPILTGGEGDGWLAGELGGFHFVQRITQDLDGRSGEEVAGAWSRKLLSAIREHDQRALITVGVIPWAHVFPKAKPLFYSEEVGDAFDFASVHFYPKSGAVDQALDALKKYEIGKPLVIEEMFPLSCSIDEMQAFIERSENLGVDGWISFFWGKTEEEYAAQTDDIASAIKAQWLKRFRNLAPEFKKRIAD